MSRRGARLALVSLPVAALCVAWAFFSSSGARAGAGRTQLFDRANEAYFAGDYARAADLYETLLETGVDDADVHYNLGTTRARMDELGRAILHFERALARRPGDEDAERSLAAARAALGARRAQSQGEATVQTRPALGEALVRPLSEPLLAGTVLALDILLFSLLVARRFVRAEAARLGLGIAAPLVALLCAASATGLAVKTDFLREGDPAVVLGDRTILREGPDPRAEPRGVAYEGEAVRLLDRHEGFARVRLPGRREGWARASEIGAL